MVRTILRWGGCLRRNTASPRLPVCQRRANRKKVLGHDSIGVWLAAKRLNAGRFVWPRDVTGTVSLNRAQFDALVLGLPQRIGEAGVITLL